MNISSVQSANSQRQAASLSERYACITTPAEAFAKGGAALATLAKTSNVKASLTLHLSALSRFLNLKASLTAEHIEFISDKMLSDANYKWLNAADIKVFIERLKMGRYGEFYENLNTPKFFMALDKYVCERYSEIERIRDEENKQFKEELKNPIRLSYFINADGRIEYTAEKKAAIAAERQKQLAIEAENQRKREAASRMIEEMEREYENKKLQEMPF